MGSQNSNARAKVARLGDAEQVDFGPLAHYHPLLADGTTAIRTGIQTSQPGYVAPVHSHPYDEVLMILEGEAKAWLDGGEDEAVTLGVGDTIMLPANVAHSFCVVGEAPMRLVGIHLNPERIVNYRDRESDVNGYPVLPE
ncbi:MAG: cupin domain-containing protein [Gammaproteobacteria bacterium]|nr:cupin domain-containing protein [Gammaproteobacteria bacterium]